MRDPAPIVAAASQPPGGHPPLPASRYLSHGAITEATAAVQGEAIHPLETWQDFLRQGTAVTGGTAVVRHWPDKSFVPVTLKTQCIDCMSCVVACPHDSIGHEVVEDPIPALTGLMQAAVRALQSTPFDPAVNDKRALKGKTDYSHCKGCFVCASACPTGAIHFVPIERVDLAKFDGAPVQPEQVPGLYRAPDRATHARLARLLEEARRRLAAAPQESANGHPPLAGVINGSRMLANFVEQARFEYATFYPITPNTLLLKQLEGLSQKLTQMQSDHRLQLRTCLSEESGYAWLTGASAQGKRTLIAQGSQSLAQLYEFLNINPGLHLPVFMLELTRALAPGTTTKPDHTTTIRTSDTGEIVLFGRHAHDNYLKALLLLKLMESDGVWLPGRLVVKGFVETHAIATPAQARLALLPDQSVEGFLGHPRNPFAFDQREERSIGILDLDARYSEQRQAMDATLDSAHHRFAEVAAKLAEVSGEPALREVDRYPSVEPVRVAIVSLNDPDLSTAEYVADQLRAQGVEAGVVSVNLYRPFPSEALRAALLGVRAVAVLEYDNRAGRSGGGAFAQELRGALYGMPDAPKVIAAQVGLGGRAVTVPYLLAVYRLLIDLAAGEASRGQRWLAEHAPGGAFSLGSRGNALPETDCALDVPLTEPGTHQLVVVGRGGQGLMLVNSLIAAAATVRGQAALALIGYGALQRGGGITLSVKLADRPIRDYSDIVIADTLVAFDDDIYLQSMLPQLRPGGTLIVDASVARAAELQAQLPVGTRVVGIPSKEISRELHGVATRTNLILFGALLTEIGVKSVEELLALLPRLKDVPGVGKEAALLAQPTNREAVVAGFLACVESASPAVKVDEQAEAAREQAEKAEFVRSVVPEDLAKHLDDPAKLERAKSWSRLKKRLYRTFFRFHPLMNQIQAMYIAMGAKKPISAGDMACAGCGQINIFRTVFNYLAYCMQGRGKMYVSEQDGCGTVFSGFNRTSIWNVPYIRIAFETAHGVAAGLASSTGRDDVVISISGDGGMMQGLRSVEDVLHQQDPILHLVVVNETLGNTGGQATATTMTGAKTRDGHVSRQKPINFLTYAEKYEIQGAVASTVHLADLYRKIRWGLQVVREERRPFLLIMNFSCLEQGMNLAQSLGAQKLALDSHFFNLYSLRYRDVRDSEGHLRYRVKRVTIDWFPWTFGSWAWRRKLRDYFKTQGMMKRVVEDERLFEQDYWQIRGEWANLKRQMGPLRTLAAMLRNAFSIERATMARLIHTDMPEAARKGQGQE
jgi:pyruvate/2-oxoacid:ferredoxin oxidoreductase alpha subunit/pyruvate/2-oxoacid:ferredoxin oxidoreductase beta subunit/Pyruvate/2-oxoacid:ferredoxin oxidoreductase gamma subunit/Pyruvate/2-oxoacid:ferredoxin oxidoreductase delta subunit